MKLKLFAAVLTLPLMVGCGHQVARIDAEVTSRVTLAGSMRAERSLAIQTNGQRRTIRGDGWHWSVTPWIVGEWHYRGFRAPISPSVADYGCHISREWAHAHHWQN
jgi:hypothetical protein